MSSPKMILQRIKTRFRSYSKKRLTSLALAAVIIVVGITLIIANLTFALNQQRLTDLSKQAISKDVIKTGVLNSPVITDKQAPTTNNETKSNSGTSSTSDQSNPLPTSTNKNYIPYSCTKTIIPYTTSYKILSSVSIGDVTVYGGDNGYTLRCTPDSNGDKPADANVIFVNKTINVGDSGFSQFTENTSVPYSDLYSLYSGSTKCGKILQTIGDNTAYQMCVNATMSHFTFN